MSSKLPFRECEQMVAVRARCRKLASSRIPFALVGEPGTGRTTLGTELVAVRAEALGACVHPPIRPGGSAQLPGSPAGGETYVALVAGLEAMDAAMQWAIVAHIRDQSLAPVFVGAPSGKRGDAPQGAIAEIAALIGAVVELPPLRERAADVVGWARLFLARCVEEYRRGVALSADAERSISSAPWPGNLLQLDSRLRQAVCLTEAATLDSASLGLDAAEERPVKLLAEAVEEFKAGYVRATLERCGGNRTQAARVLGVDARTIFRYLEKERGEAGM